MLARLRVVMLVTDIGFIVYWAITGLHLIPPQYLYHDATNPLLVAWNWSFLPLDLAISATGLTGWWLWRRGSGFWLPLVVVSLTLTVCSGLQAIAFWALRGDFAADWWLVNG
ncbi:MAG: DUF5360 family protein, partial [Ktedonobacterales bacterium]|nr:DUF5360 family protein [Ktedonobacterales bacterium]